MENMVLVGVTLVLMFVVGILIGMCMGYGLGRSVQEPGSVREILGVDWKRIS